ncbi:type II secretion system F family protein [bacterium]|nr:MAG: type II secretion system F family protein [bacterium]
MAIFEYKVKDKSGKILKGTVEEDSKEKIISRLHEQGMVIVSLKEAKKSIFSNKSSGKVSPEEIVIFTRQLTTLINSGISLVQALEILSEQVKNAYFREVISKVLSEVKEGRAFNVALAGFRNVFSNFYISMVEAGEISGNLTDILDRVSIYLEKTVALKRKVKSSLTYPIVVVVMAIAITTFLIIKVVPTFKQIFSSLNAQLPVPTQMLLSLSDSLRTYFLWIVGFIVLFSVLAKKYIATPKGREKFDKFLLNLPVFGDILKKVAIAHFCRTFSTLIKSGVPVLNALDIVGATSGNKVIENTVRSAKQYVQQGEPLSVPLAESRIFPVMVTRMISIGEKSGKMEEMLSKISEFYEEEVDTAVSSLTSIIEPLIIGFLGIVIGGIVIALFLPIINITKVIGR